MVKRKYLYTKSQMIGQKLGWGFFSRNLTLNPSLPRLRYWFKMYWPAIARNNEIDELYLQFIERRDGYKLSPPWATG